jgi:GNAT superfamily N-acetyltransferase
LAREEQTPVLPAGFHLRLAERDEARLLRDLMLRCWTGTVASDSSAYRETEEAIAGQLERGGGAIVFEGATPVGGGRFYPVPGPANDPREWVEIKRVGVLKSHRKLGLGAPLVAALEAEARRRGFAGAQLGVRQDQPRLVSFWSSLGYELADDVRMHTVNPLTPPPVTMRKRFGG